MVQRRAFIAYIAVSAAGGLFGQRAFAAPLAKIAGADMRGPNRRHRLQGDARHQRYQKRQTPSDDRQCRAQQRAGFPAARQL